MKTLNMKDKDYYMLIKKAKDMSAEDFLKTYIGNKEILNTSDNVKQAEMLNEIWGMAHVTARDIRLYLGMTQTAFADWTLTSLRTVQEWEYETRGHCPLGRVIFMAARAGMYAVPETRPKK